MPLSGSGQLLPGDREFFDSVYEGFKRTIYATIKKYVSDSEAVDDLVQDTVINLLAKTLLLRGLNEAALCTYIVTTARNTAKNYLKHQELRYLRFTDGPDICEVGDDIRERAISSEELLLMGERRAEFYAAFKKLNERDRVLLGGKYLLGMDDAELAKLVRCKPGSIRMALTRARRHAFEIMKKGNLGDE